MWMWGRGHTDVRVASSFLRCREWIRGVQSRPYLPPSTQKDLTIPPERFESVAEAVSRTINSGDTIYLHMAAANPVVVQKEMVKQADRLKGCQVVHMHLEGECPIYEPQYDDSFRMNALFLSGQTRKVLAEGRGDFTPCFFSEIPLLFRRGILPIDVAVVQVSPPDIHGFCSLGVSVDCSLAAVRTAKHVIGVVNRYMPRTLGDGLIHMNHLDSMVSHDCPLPEVIFPDSSSIEKKIGQFAASLIPDRACLQMGIGNIPDAVLAELRGHKDLGIHTEMFADRVIDLVDSGVITNKYKKHFSGRIVSTFLVGSRRIYDFVHDNPLVAMLDVQYVNDPRVIASNDRVCAINSAIEVDITGQVSADSIGTKMYSGVGGQMDFLRGARLSNGGVPIIALPSTTSKGEPRIVATLKPGAGVVTTRSHVGYIITEYGIAEMYGKSLKQRAVSLIKISHPDHRETLLESAEQRFGKLSISKNDL